jgi:hypothetical protein
MRWPSELSCFLPFTPDSSLTKGLHLLAAVAGGPAHRFEIDTGSVGILVPRQRLGPDYQNFDPSLDTKLQFVSSGNTYWGQWVNASVILGVPAVWDGTGDYRLPEVGVFAVDRPIEFDSGILGIGFAIGGSADGGPARNPLLHLTYQGKTLHAGYIIKSTGLDAGLTAINTNGFAFIELQRDLAGIDWMQPMGSLGLPNGFSIDLPLLMDTGIDEMLLWLKVAKRPPALANYSRFPPGIEVTIAVPPSPKAPVLQYSFITGEGSEPMAPPTVQWRDGKGINTGRNVLAGAGYLYDAANGLIGFRIPPSD